MTVRGRVYKKVSFDSAAASTTWVVTIPMSEGGSGKISVYATRKTGGGSSTLALDGSFVDAPGSSDKFSLKVATAVGGGNITQLVTGIADEFPYYTLTWVPTGTSTEDVYIVSF